MPWLFCEKYSASSQAVRQAVGSQEGRGGKQRAHIVAPLALRCFASLSPRAVDRVLMLGGL